MLSTTHGMHCGQFRNLSDAPPVDLAFLYGTRGPVGPGWYLLDRQWGPLGVPLAGPFERDEDAAAEWARHFALLPTRESGTLAPVYDRMAYRHPQTLVLDPCVILRPERVSFDKHARLDSFSKIEGGDGVYLGRGVHIASFCHVNIGGGITILEEGASMGSGARTISGSAVPDAPSCSATHPAARTTKGVCRLKPGATLYAGATLLPGLTIGEGAKVAAGSVVTKDIPAWQLWAGVPARFVRNIERGSTLDI